MELDALAKAAADIEDLGATLVMISPQKIEHSRRMIKGKKKSVVMLSDPGNETAARYGIRFELPQNLKKIYRQFGINLDEYNGDDSWTLPLPARFIIDREGIIRHADVNADYTVRSDPQETVEILKEIA